MRLLVVSQYFWPENFIINDLVSSLEHRGHKVTVLTGLPNYPSGYLDKDFVKRPIKYTKFNGVEVIRVPMISRGSSKIKLILNYISFALSASIIGVYKLRKYNFDLIFVFEPSPITVGLPAVLLRRIKKVPLIFWVLDLWPDTLEAIGVIRHRPLLKFIGKLVSFIYNKCDLILGQSKSFLPHIGKYSRHRNIEYFPSWADSEFSNINYDFDKTNNDKVKFNIVFTGNIGEAQDFPAIIDAVELLKMDPDILWTFVGDGRYLNWVEKEIISRDLVSIVNLVGRHPVKKIPEFFEQADALLVSLKDEPIFSMTIPGKLQSYLTSGKPILAMLNGVGANIVKDSGCGLVCNAGDSRCLVNAINKLKQMTYKERIMMGHIGLKLSQQEFNRDKLIDSLEGRMLNLSNNNIN